MKFSVVTSFYNEDLNYIESVCNSVLSQTYSNFEWIVTEDFSNNEETKNAVKNLPSRDKRIKFIEQQEKKEIWWNPQTYATGDVVVIVDGDDVMFPKTLEIYNYFYNKYPDVFCMTTDIKNYRENTYCGSLYLNYENYKSHLNMCAGIKHNSSLPDHVRNEVFSHGYNRSWRNISGINFKENLDTSLIINDYIQLTKLEEYGKLLHVPRALYGYNYRDESISRKIDEFNNYTYDTAKAGIVIDNRRKGKNINSIKRIFEQIYIESNAFLDSSLSHDNKSKKVLFVTPETLSPIKEEQIRELYFDNEFIFNKYDDNVDYCVVQFNSSNQRSYFYDIYDNIKKYIGKIEVMIQISYKNADDPDNNLFTEFKNFLESRHSLYWFDYNNRYLNIKIY